MHRTTMIESILQKATAEVLQALYHIEESSENIVIQKTNKEFTGDYTIVVFPFLKQARKAPQQLAQELGETLKKKVKEIQDFNVIKGFLNLSVTDDYWIDFFKQQYRKASQWGVYPRNGETIVVEYSSPNTNKPLHLGHVRNNLLGWSISEILKAYGYDVKKVNLVNDRGIHICKSMLAWLRFGNGETPESSGMKGDHLVGKYYVLFDKAYKQEISELVASGMKKEEAEEQAPILLEAQEMLRRWEAKDAEIIALWERMNTWVYAGFDETYKKMGVGFDKVYYESNTYLLGKSIVNKGLEQGVLYRREDGSVWADLRNEGLDEKLLLRKDGTSVYMTQDLGTACLRHEDFKAKKLIYVVGNEQNYHFDVLKRIMKKLGFEWAEQLYHLSYGMVELPEGKMKSREGTVVDADDLMEEMIETAKTSTEEHGKTDAFSQEDAQKLYETLGIGALKYFILKVDPVKNMLFNPKESIDFNGNTGPFIQYTHARICSIIRKAKEQGIDMDVSQGTITSVSDREKEILKLLHEYPFIVKTAAESYSPAVIAGYAFDLAKSFNAFYQDTPILKSENKTQILYRIQLCSFVGSVLKNAFRLLGIDVPDRM